MGGKTPKFSAGGKDTMTGDDERNRVLSQRLPRGAGGTGPPQSIGEFAIGHGPSRRDFPGRRINLPRKGTDSFQINRDILEILGLALKVFA